MSEATAILIRNATILSIDLDIGIQNDCDLLIVGNTIQEIGPNLQHPVGLNSTIIDATNCIITPGFVDGHHHVWQHLLRTVATDWSLFDYCVEMRTLYGSFFTPEDVYLAQYAGALSLLSNGVTCVLDHCHIINTPSHADAAVTGLMDAGIRGTFCYGFYQNPPMPKRLDTGSLSANFTMEMRRQDASRIRDKYFRTNDPSKALLTFGISPNEPESQALSSTIDEIKQARQLGARLTTFHVAMGPYDLARRQIVQGIADADCLGPDLVLSHGASFTEKEISTIAKSGAGIVGTPETELQMGMGYPVVFKAHDAGCRTCLGLDITSNQGNDFVFQMRLALQTQRAVENEKTFPEVIKRKTRDVLRMGTLGGAEVMGIEHIVGSLAPGKRADLVIFKCDDIDTVPIINPEGTIVFNTSTANIDTVMVDGRIVKKDGKLVGVDWPQLRKEIIERSKKIVAEAGVEDVSEQRQLWKNIFGK